LAVKQIDQLFFIGVGMDIDPFTGFGDKLDHRKNSTGFRAGDDVSQLGFPKIQNRGAAG